MRRAFLTGLAVLGVAAGLAVTASSTSATAYDAGMRGLALAAVVVVLEVTNTLGTLVWLTDPRRHAKWQAAALVACASIVTGYCGAKTYGAIGLVGPFFVLAGVHLANLAATTPPPDRQAAPGGSAQPPAQPSPDAGVPAHRHAGTPTPPAQAEPAQADTPTEPPAQAAAQPTEETPTPPSTPTPTVSAQPDPPTRLDDEAIVAQLLARPETPGRDAICREFRCGKTKAERVLTTLADRRRPHLVTTREETAR